MAYRMDALGYTDMPDDAPHDPEELAEVDAEFHNWLNEERAKAWEEGRIDGQINAENEAAIAYGTRKEITNPYRQEHDQ